jgi:hypothetical protein
LPAPSIIFFKRDCVLRPTRRKTANACLGLLPSNTSLSPSKVDKMEDKHNQDNVANKKAEEVARAAEDAVDAAQAERIRLLSGHLVAKVAEKR